LALFAEKEQEQCSEEDQEKEFVYKDAATECEDQDDDQKERDHGCRLPPDDE
jgi:hypothetical protein